MALTSDNRYFISGSYDGPIKVFDLQAKKEIHRFENADAGMKISRSIINQSWDFMTSVAVTLDNRSLICGSKKGSIKVFDLHAKQLAHQFENAHKGTKISRPIINQS